MMEGSGGKPTAIGNTARSLADRVRDALSDRYRIGHTNLQFEHTAS